MVLLHNLNLAIDNYVRVNKKILQLSGLYPICLRRYSVCVFCMLLIVIPEIFRIYQNSDNFEVILETSSVLLTIISTILKSILWIFQVKAESFINFLFNDYWTIAISLNEYQCICKHAQMAKNVTFSYTFFIANAVLIFYCFPLLSGARKYIKDDFINYNDTINGKNIDQIHFPFPASYPQFCYELPYFAVVYVTQILSTSICGLIILGIDTTIATAIFHSCGYFVSLRKSIEKLNFDVLHDNSQIIRIIKHHNIVLSFSGKIEEVFNSMILVQVVASSIIICLVGFQMNTGFSETDKLAQYLSYFLMALFQLLLFCWPGDKLINYSFMINYAVYSKNWYQVNNKIKTDILLLILRAQKPCCLTAGKFQVMRLESFTVILSTSLSYFMLLDNLSK